MYVIVETFPKDVVKWKVMRAVDFIKTAKNEYSSIYICVL